MHAIQYTHLDHPVQLYEVSEIEQERQPRPLVRLALPVQQAVGRCSRRGRGRLAVAAGGAGGVGVGGVEVEEQELAGRRLEELCGLGGVG